MKSLEWIKESEAVAFLQDLVRIKTVNPPGNEKEAAQYVADRLRRKGIDAEVMEVSPGRANVVSWLGGRSQSPALMLNGHLAGYDPGRGSVLILDDALGYTHPERLRLMGAVLAKAAKECQIIIFTFGPDRYGNVGKATVVSLK